MRLITLLGIALFTTIGCMHTAMATEASAPVKVTLAWHLSLDAQGNITQMQPIGKSLADPIAQVRERLAKAIEEWRFIPGSLDGKPAQTETQLVVNATLLAVDAQTLQIRVDDANTGSWVSKTRLPRYPKEAVIHHKTGQVVLKVDFDATGNVIAAAPIPDSPKVDKSLVDAAVKSVKGWSFKTEIVGGHGVAGTSIAPFCFTLRRLGGREEGRCDWKAPGHDSPMPQGEALALNPAARLTTAVAGRVL